MGTQATYDDANLILRLYELRREEKLRKAREWFGRSFHATTLGELEKLCPRGSEENAYFRMLVGYWEMAASLVASGVLHKELFFENSGEFLFVWERTRQLLPQIREISKNPAIGKNTEAVAKAFIEWLKAQAPEAYTTYQAMLARETPGR
jgi:hypothetical protein